MPPIRTMPPAKVLKTERTHEENQERAYIAASRRSDRSLEARVESARRASEIHKRRTGRSLRVTEQDVVNEEMYEEEDDDLPMQYRRLTAHLQTGSADFNRRLSAYLTNHVAMRSALDQAITNSYAQQYPNAPQFAHNQNAFPSPFAQPSPQADSPRSLYGQPYPTPGTPDFPSNYHTRRASQPVPHGNPNFGAPLPTPPPNSAPASAVGTTHADQRRVSHSSQSTSKSPVQQRNSIPPTPHSHGSGNGHGHQATHESSTQRGLSGDSQDFTVNGYPNMSPFSMALPMDAQMLLNGALDPNDPMTSAMMADSNQFSHPQIYGFTDDTKVRSRSHPFGGMSATLAPGMLDMQPRQHEAGQQNSLSAMPPSSKPVSTFDVEGTEYPKGLLFNSSQESHTSGTVTPGLDGWDSFINDTPWNESVT